jgi:hypothetical protein
MIPIHTSEFEFQEGDYPLERNITLQVTTRRVRNPSPSRFKHMVISPCLSLFPCQSSLIYTSGWSAASRPPHLFCEVDFQLPALLLIFCLKFGRSSFECIILCTRDGARSNFTAAFVSDLSMLAPGQ